MHRKKQERLLCRVGVPCLLRWGRSLPSDPQPRINRHDCIVGPATCGLRFFFASSVFRTIFLGMATPTTAPVKSQNTTEQIIWYSVCFGLSLLGFILATYDYVKKVYSTPAAKRKRRAKQEHRQQMAEDQKVREVSGEPVPIREFLSEWKRRTKKKKALHYEFRAVDMKSSDNQRKFAEIATSAENVLKNSDPILPYEDNIVSLPPTSDFPSTYVNASWIDGYSRPKKFIAAQGPNAESVENFLAMVWRIKVKCIVMINQVFENGRECGIRYWKESLNTPAKFGQFSVTTTDASNTTDYILRFLKVEFKGVSHLFHHFQFINWTEQNHTSITGLLEVRRKLTQLQGDDEAPILVQCSNGSSRTGIFICIDMNISRFLGEHPIDIFGSAVRLRKQRHQTIATLAQYRFVYEAVANFVTCGNTVLKAEHLARKVQQLALKVNLWNTGFEEELKQINSFLPKLTIGECAAGHRAENRWKSRDIMLQPPERSRPYLASYEYSGGNDYINATFVDGFRATNQFIVTQWPLKGTVNDVWRLVHTHKVSVVVVLNDMNKGTRSDKAYPRFWPTVRNQSTGFGPIAVELVNESNLNANIRCRVFKIKKIVADLSPKVIEAMRRFGVEDRIFELLKAQNHNEDERYVVMLQTTCWSNRHRIPESTIGLIQLVEKSESFYQELSADNTRANVAPILVISKDGVSRAGCFCVLSISIDRIKNEGEVDIFRTTELVKRNRPHLIDSIVDYAFCYTAVLVYLERMNIVQNQDEPSSCSCSRHARCYCHVSRASLESMSEFLTPSRLSGRPRPLHLPCSCSAANITFPPDNFERRQTTTTFLGPISSFESFELKESFGMSA